MIAIIANHAVGISSFVLVFEEIYRLTIIVLSFQPVLSLQTVQVYYSNAVVRAMDVDSA